MVYGVCNVTSEVTSWKNDEILRTQSKNLEDVSSGCENLSNLGAIQEHLRVWFEATTTRAWTKGKQKLRESKPILRAKEQLHSIKSLNFLTKPQ